MNPYVLDNLDPRIGIPAAVVAWITYAIIVRVQNRRENHRG